MCKEILSLFSALFASYSGHGQDVFTVTQKGVSWQGRGLFELKLWKHTVKQLEQAASILNQRAQQELLDHPRGSTDLCYAFYFAAVFFPGLCRWRFLHFPRQTQQVQNEVISVVKMSTHPPLMSEGWDDNLRVWKCGNVHTYLPVNGTYTMSPWTLFMCVFLSLLPQLHRTMWCGF